MKKIMIALTALFTTLSGANAMSYEQAREQALFLTDKMAYELNLTDDQYEAAYEINLDYLMTIENQADLYGTYWTRRNLDLSYILLQWQYDAYVAATYFYRPIYFDAGFWHFGIYARYPHRTFLYFGRPAFYISYRGGHAWHHNGGHSWYHGRSFGHAHHNHGGHGPGMRTHYDEHHGGGNHGHNGGSHNGNHSGSHNGGNHGNSGNNSGYSASNVNRGYGNSRRESSTRTTVDNVRTGSSTFDRSRSSNAFDRSRSSSVTSRFDRSTSSMSRSSSMGSVSRPSSSVSRSSGAGMSRSSGASMSRSGSSGGGFGNRGGRR